MISGVRELAIASSPPSRFWTAAVAMIVRGHSELAAMPSSLQLLGQAERAQAHPVLGDRVAEVRARPTSGRG